MSQLKNFKIHYYKKEFDVACDFVTNYAYRKAKHIKTKINIANLMSVISCITLLCIISHILRVITISPLYSTGWWTWLIIFIAINITSVCIGKTLWYNVEVDPFLDEYTLVNASVPTENKTRKQIFADKYKNYEEQRNNRIFMLHKIFSQAKDGEIGLAIDDNKMLVITYTENGIEKEFALYVDGVFNQSDINIPLEQPRNYDKIIITPIYCIVVFSETSDNSLANTTNS